jgi:hypothetical protein
MILIAGEILDITMLVHLDLQITSKQKQEVEAKQANGCSRGGGVLRFYWLVYWLLFGTQD